MPNFSLLAGWMEPVEADLFYPNLYDNIEIYVEIMGFLSEETFKIKRPNTRSSKKHPKEIHIF